MASLDNNTVLCVLAHKNKIRRPPEKFLWTGNKSKVREPIADAFLGDSVLTWDRIRHAGSMFDRDVGPFWVVGCDG
jgi:hypothetical protein